MTRLRRSPPPPPRGSASWPSASSESSMTEACLVRPPCRPTGLDPGPRHPYWRRAGPVRPGMWVAEGVRRACCGAASGSRRLGAGIAGAGTWNGRRRGAVRGRRGRVRRFGRPPVRGCWRRRWRRGVWRRGRVGCRCPVGRHGGTGQDEPVLLQALKSTGSEVTV